MAESSSGFYHRGERENQDYTKKGLLFRTIRRDKTGALFTREENSYEVLTVQAEQQLAPPLQGVRPAVRFPSLSRTEKHFYEGRTILSGDLSPLDSVPAGAKRSGESFTYETTFGNVIAYTDEGDLDTPADNAQATIAYFQDTAAYIVKPNSITVTNNNTTTTKYDALGRIENIIGVLSARPAERV